MPAKILKGSGMIWIVIAWSKKWRKVYKVNKVYRVGECFFSTSL